MYSWILFEIAGQKFKGKVVWITGASRGIGASLAVSFARCGAKLVLMARNREQLEKVQAQCIGKIWVFHVSILCC